MEFTGKFVFRLSAEIGVAWIFQTFRCEMRTWNLFQAH